MIRPERERAAFGDDRLRMHATDTEVALQERAAHHANRSRRDVVIVPACVVPRRPADKPDVYILVAMDRGVMPPADGIGNLIAPQIRVTGQVLNEFGQLTLVEIPGGQHGKNHCGYSPPAAGQSAPGPPGCRSP